MRRLILVMSLAASSLFAEIQYGWQKQGNITALFSRIPIEMFQIIPGFVPPDAVCLFEAMLRTDDLTTQQLRMTVRYVHDGQMLTVIRTLDVRGDGQYQMAVVWAGGEVTSVSIEELKPFSSAEFK